MWRATVTLVIVCFNLCLFPAANSSLAATIRVDAGEMLGPVNKLLFGNAQPFGHGDVLLEGGSCDFDERALSLVSALNPTVLRFPGGIHADEYFWEDGIGPRHLRPQPRRGQYQPFGFSYGIDEHMALCQKIGAEAFITVNYGTGIVGDSLSVAAPLSQRVDRAVDWVEYCNAPNDGSNPNEGVDWAAVRAENGHPEPYGVKFWEIGNEICGGQQTGHTDVETYAQDFITFSQAMKAVDADIEIGAVGSIAPHWRTWWNRSSLEWNATLLQIAGQDMDFLVVHCHYPGITTVDGADLYRAGMAGVDQALLDLQEIRRIIDEQADPSIGIVPGENGFTGGGEEHWELCASLLAGLQLADLLIMFLQQGSELNIPFACGWTLHSPTYGGDIAYKWSPERRFARPECSAQEMLREHLGEMLVANSVDCGTFSTVEVVKVKARPDVPELAGYSSIDSCGTKLNLLVVNRQLDQDVETTIQIEGFEPQPEASMWILNGPDITATNEEDPNNVNIVAAKLAVTSEGYCHTFPAHSLTAIQFIRSAGDTSSPILSDMQITELTGSSAKVTWSTDEPADSWLEYGLQPGDYQHAVEDFQLTTEHVVWLQSLDSESTYYFRALSRDAQGNEASPWEASFRTLDVTPPQISQLEVMAVTESTATICWITDELADSRVQYQMEDGPLEALMDSSLIGAHVLLLPELEPARSYAVWVSSADSAGNVSQASEGSFVTASPRSAAQDPTSSEPMPWEYRLWQNYPNPFNAHTNIRYQLPTGGKVVVRIYNPLGQLVKTLVEEYQPAGHYQLSWDARDVHGEDVASGIYLCYLQAGDFTETCKMALVR